MRYLSRTLALGVLLSLTAAGGSAQDVPSREGMTLMLSQPAVSGEHVAFTYAGDLWVARHDGSGVRRLTTHEGVESNPRFAPDGRTLAFSGQYDGNRDVYVVPVEGGVPKRLTWHPYYDVVQDFTVDGSAVLFISGRASYTGSHLQLYTVSLDGGFPERLPIPTAFKAAYSPDGSQIAYTPLAEAFNQWKNYRGGTATRIWIIDLADYSVVQIPQPEGRCNDTDPMWIGDRVYFRSDRNGEFNLFSFDPATSRVEQLTDHSDFPIVNASAGAGLIAYEQAGYLHLFDPAVGASRPVPIHIATDLIEVRPRYVDGASYIRNHAISPSGARAVFEFRGEIVTVPKEKGDPRDITESTGVHERSPAWSPDGVSIAYFSDESGEYALHIAPQDGKGEPRKIALDGAGFYEDPKWSPDGRKISYTDNAHALYWLDVESGRSQRIAADEVYSPLASPYHSWSPDSRWIAYTRNNTTNIHSVHVYSLEADESYPITDGLSEVFDPVFDASGRYLYMIASTDAGPVIQWFAQSNQDFEMTSTIYLAVLERGTPSPLAKESDEEEPVGEGQESESSADGDDEITVRIDFDGLDQRILDLPLEPGTYLELTPGPAGKLYYLKSDEGLSFFGGGTGELSLAMFDLDEREEKTLVSGVREFALSADHEQVLYRSGSNWFISGAASVTKGEGRLATDEIEVRIDPRAEWRQIYEEAWRINRDYFYDPNMHGADWPALKEKYAVFLPHVATRSDLNRVMRWLHSELAVGHHGVGGGDVPERPESVPGGLLGADYEIADGRYRFAKVYGGLNWNPELRSPLTEPGVEVEAGEYLLAVEGEDLRPPENLYSRFENSAGKIVEITVGPNPDGSSARTVDVVPLSSEYGLRSRDWVEGNLAKVHEATDGRVAYVYVPNTAGSGHSYFKRYFFPQADKEAVIVDERHNGGGQIADYYINILRRQFISYWAMRYGADLRTPQGAILGPKVMLIDETAGSGGDLLPWMFRRFKLGTLIGRRTWGGLVGVLGFPVLMDGGGITAPNLAIWTEDGWVVENVGVPPDIEVEMNPADVIAGRDPQLEKAIEVILEQLEANPPARHTRPPYPVRARR
ncbi:MAG: PDZ domain-containing protein [Gemmatimonadales bacterium]|jgi:tricorn protease